MARRTPKTNGRASTNGRGRADANLVVTQAEQVAAAAGVIARITDDVSTGAEAQIRSLDGTLSGLNEMVVRLRLGRV